MCPRKARYQSLLNTYHILLSGNASLKIFLDDEDKNAFIRLLSEKGNNKEYEIYAYSILDDHAHLLLKETDIPISYSMQRINTAYAAYFNRKYNRSGTVFDGRFKSEAIDDEESLSSVICFIHKNPTLHDSKKDYKSYPFSSFQIYEKGNEKHSLIPPSVAEKTEDYEISMNDIYAENCVSMLEKYALNLIDSFMERNALTINELKQRCYLNERRTIVLLLRDNTNFSIRKISELLDLNRGVVYKIICSTGKEDK